MSLQWTLVACFLYLEILVVITLLLPFISAARWQKLFKSKVLQGISRQGHIYFYVFIGILILFFCDSIRDMSRYSHEKEAEGDHGHVTAEMQLSVRLFRSQRNFYISGFALFLWLVINRLVTLISEHATLNSNYVAALQQAKSATETAEQLLQEKEQNQQSLREEVENEGNKQKDVLDSKIIDLEFKLETAEKENSTLTLDVETIKKQAEATNKEYDRLMKEHESLQLQIKLAEGDGACKKDD